jgi:hypothetical protein
MKFKFKSKVSPISLLEEFNGLTEEEKNLFVNSINDTEALEEAEQKRNLEQLESLKKLSDEVSSLKDENLKLTQKSKTDDETFSILKRESESKPASSSKETKEKISSLIKNIKI